MGCIRWDLGARIWDFACFFGFIGNACYRPGCGICVGICWEWDVCYFCEMVPWFLYSFFWFINPLLNIQVLHSSDFDYKKELYAPLRANEYMREHDILLPHETSEKGVGSYETLRQMDLVIAEVSYPSTGMGMELGWAYHYRVPILMIHKKGAHISGSLRWLDWDVVSYENTEDMIQKIIPHLSR